MEGGIQREKRRLERGTKGRRRELRREREREENGKNTGSLFCVLPTAMVHRDLPGYAIGGLSGGEEKDIFWKVVSLCTDLLPRHKPRYLMGVG